MAAPLKTFIIYARADDAAKSQLILQLGPLIKRKALDVWHDGNILPGEEWDAVIKRELTDSELVLFLVSASSLNSDYIQKEFKTALERLAAGHTRIIPIVVAPCGWKYDPILSGLQALPHYKAEGVKPVRSWPDPDEAWASVVDHLGEMVIELQRQRDLAEQQLRDKANEEQAKRNEQERIRQAQELKKRRDAATAFQKEMGLKFEATQRYFEEKYPRRKQYPIMRTVIYGSLGLLIFLLGYWMWNSREKQNIAAKPQSLSVQTDTTKFQHPSIAQKFSKDSQPATSTKLQKILVPKKSLEDIQPNMVFIDGGTFQMGSNNGEGNEKPVHAVSVDGFYLGKYEVTVAEYLRFVDETKSHYAEWLEKDNKYNVETGSDVLYKKIGYSRGAPNLPIVGVSWNDAIAYCVWMSGKNTGKIYRLPTEAEWEYAACGGNSGANYIYAGSNNLAEVAWYTGNSNSKPHPIGQKKPNKMGLYDMSGNVWEWCSDYYGPYDASNQINPRGGTSGKSRVFRGGSWTGDTKNCQVSYRAKDPPGARNHRIGFRLASNQ